MKHISKQILLITSLLAGGINSQILGHSFSIKNNTNKHALVKVYEIKENSDLFKRWGWTNKYNDRWEGNTFLIGVNPNGGVETFQGGVGGHISYIELDGVKYPRPVNCQDGECDEGKFRCASSPHIAENWNFEITDKGIDTASEWYDAQCKRLK